MINKIKEYKKTTAFTLISIAGMINTLALAKNPIGFLFLSLPLIAYKLESSGHYKKQDKMMHDCRNNDYFNDLQEKHKDNLN